MDLLEQYKQQRPEAFKPSVAAQPTTDPYGREYGTMVRLAMRLSGGRIRDARQASYALLAVAVMFGIATLLIFFSDSLGSNKIQGHPLTPASPMNSMIR